MKINTMAVVQPTEAELEILQILWADAPCTIRDVHEKISQIRQIGYTTTQKQMQRMLEKTMIRRTNEKGNHHEYEAILKEDEVQQNLFDRLVHTAFKGSAMKVVMHALGQAKAEPEELEKLMEWLKSQKQNKND